MLLVLLIFLVRAATSTAVWTALCGQRHFFESVLSGQLDLLNGGIASLIYLLLSLEAGTVVHLFADQYAITWCGTFPNDPRSRCATPRLSDRPGTHWPVNVAAGDANRGAGAADRIKRERRKNTAR